MWQLEKKYHGLALELAAYALTRSFSYVSHQIVATLVACVAETPC